MGKYTSFLEDMSYDIFEEEDYLEEMRKEGKKVELIRMSAKRTLEDYQAYAEKGHFETLIYLDGAETKTFQCQH